MMTENQFKVDQLRKDKIIYAVEAIAVNTCCLLVYLASDHIETTMIPALFGWVRPLSVLLAVGYSLFMGVGNFVRLQMIKKIEQEQL